MIQVLFLFIQLWIKSSDSGGFFLNINPNCYVIETSTTMSKPTYINKATLEELTSIAGIGEIRAQKMLKKKQENGSYLTLQDLKLMTDIPTTIWDPLMEAVEIRI